MSEGTPWTRESLLAAIEKYLVEVVDEDASGDGDLWMIAMFVRSTALLKIATRFLREADAPEEAA